MDEPPICIRIICPTVRCIFITTISQWNGLIARLKKFDPQETLYLEGEFNTSIGSILKADILKDTESLNAYKTLFGKKVWIGLDMMTFIEEGLRILESEEDPPESEITELPPININKQSRGSIKEKK